jgi:nitrate reductase gamma subunit
MRVLAAILLALACAFIVAATSPAATQAPEVAMQPPGKGFDIRPCQDCHRLPNTNTNEGIRAANNLCMECHGQKACVREEKGKQVSLRVDLDSFGTSRHRYKACLDCHYDVGRSPHASADGVQCLSCHTYHGEGDFGGPHMSVSCEACHHKSKFVKLDKKLGMVGLAKVDDKGMPISLVDHGKSDYTSDDLCLRCHVDGNKAGAPAQVLPEKGFICFVCHTASISAGGPWLGGALVIFIIGLLIMIRFWLQGRVQGEEESMHNKIARGSENLVSTFFSREGWRIIGVFVLDVLLQRRLLQESVQRWFVHTLIYWSILSRLILGVFTWLVWQIGPESDLAVALIDKNHGFNAVFHDLTGLLMLLGVALSALQRVVLKPKNVDTSAQDALALIFIGLIALLGFALEAVRIHLISLPPEQGVYAFVAYPLSRLASGMAVDWNNAYGWLWYAHAIVAAALIAWLPFGKMRHVITTPISLVMNRDLK